MIVVVVADDDVDVCVEGVDALCVDEGTHATAPSTDRQPVMLSFQRLDVYQRATEFLALATEIIEQMPRGNAGCADQLLRSAESVIRNIAEGSGRWSKADSAKHYKIARGEAMECAASLDVLKIRNLVAGNKYEEGIKLLERVVKMLTKMV